MFFSVQKFNRMYSVEFSPELVQIKVQENSFWSLSSPNGYPDPSLAHGRSDAKGFQRASYDASTHHREIFWRNANDEGSV